MSDFVAAPGRVVHYVLADGQHRPAEIVQGPLPGGRVNLTVTLDQLNDVYGPVLVEQQGGKSVQAPNPRRSLVRDNLVPAGAYGIVPGFLAVGSALRDEEGKVPGSWHAPERAG